MNPGGGASADFSRFRLPSSNDVVPTARFPSRSILVLYPELVDIRVRLVASLTITSNALIKKIREQKGGSYFGERDARQYRLFYQQVPRFRYHFRRRRPS